MRRIGPRGEGTLGCLLWAAALAVAILIAVKAVPVKLNDVEFGDYIEEQAQFSGRATGDTLRQRILKKANELDIPLDPKNLRIEKTQHRVRIRCHYTVTVDFGVYTYDWTFEHELDRPIFIV